MDEEIEGVVTDWIKFTYSIVDCQSQVDQESLRAVMVYSAHIGEINEGFISQDMEGIVVLKGCSKTVEIGDETEGQKCKDIEEIRIDDSGNFSHYSAPMVKPILLVLGLRRDKSQEKIFQVQTLWLN